MLSSSPSSENPDGSNAGVEVIRLIPSYVSFLDWYVFRTGVQTVYTGTVANLEFNFDYLVDDGGWEETELAWREADGTDEFIWWL